MVHKDNSVLQVVTDKNQWLHLLKEVGDFDFYHTHDYHSLSKLEEEEPKLIVYRNQDKTILLPLLIRPVKNTKYFDATSVYGYAGPLTKNITKEFDPRDFHLKLTSFLNDENIVSVFTRLNPFIPYQKQVLKELGNIDELGKVVYIDLMQEESDQISGYSKITKRYLKKLEKLCYVKRSNHQKDILKFVNLYYENMDRVDAGSEYYFEESYFFKLVNSSEFQAELVFIHMKDTHKAIAAAIIVKTNGAIVQYHISGTLMKHLKISPIRFLIHKMRMNSVEENYRFFNLGGGLGGQNDSLFQFKSSFSKNYRNFGVWKFVVDQNVYSDLCKKNIMGVNKKVKDFFPLYRAK
ncbi:GNAT family N-acetyltransferase [Flagellimonas sp. 389]|nr:GNAT family N-acetyltransferase [Flagellimonas sp. 389]